MNFDFNFNKIIDLLKQKDKILIITHKNPDGDAIGSSFALYYALLKLGKKVEVDIGKRLSDIYRWVKNDYDNKLDFEPEYIVAVDLADTKLLLDHLKIFEKKIDLVIDHHPSNTGFASQTLLDSKASATTELLYDVIVNLIGEENIDSQIASCLYLGLSTDTGCFRYSSVTSKTHLVAASLINKNANYFYINKKMFDTKSKKKLEIEQIVLSKIEYFFNDRCAIIFISKELKQRFDIADDELENLSALPIQIEGVEVGVTIKEKDKDLNNEYKISIRTSENFDASEICKNFGGGGHKRAAGCSLDGNYQDTKNKLLKIISKYIN
ncbi:MAG: bifunctional oligoribonuclease/PAP phosphatase NrnA [Oscillospiraceae bacterium]|nr:bifunctional oligoribonuclease/PAP phosphatase NrnA [Oscillospiraceae bacterium]